MFFITAVTCSGGHVIRADVRSGPSYKVFLGDTKLWLPSNVLKFDPVATYCAGGYPSL